jgi:hypothetical protein
MRLPGASRRHGNAVLPAVNPSAFSCGHKTPGAAGCTLNNGMKTQLKKPCVLLQESRYASLHTCALPLLANSMFAGRYLAQRHTLCVWQWERLWLLCRRRFWRLCGLHRQRVWWLWWQRRGRCAAALSADGRALMTCCSGQLHLLTHFHAYRQQCCSVGAQCPRGLFDRQPLQTPCHCS